MSNRHETQKAEEAINQPYYRIYVPEEIELEGKSIGEKEMQPFSISFFPKPIRWIGYMIAAFFVLVCVALAVLNIIF